MRHGNQTETSIGKAQLIFLGIIWFIVLSAMLVYDARGQSIELVRPADFRYYVTVDGDTLSSRSLDYKATQDAYQFKIMYPNSRVVIHPLGIEVRGFFAIPPDTVYVPADTVYVPEIIYEPSPPDTVIVTDTLFVDLPPDTVRVTDTTYVNEVVKYYDASYDFSGVAWHPAVRDVNLEVRQAVADTTGRYRIAVEANTTASAISVATNCYGPSAIRRDSLINERVSGRVEADSTGLARWESNDLNCRGIMTFWVTERDSNNFSVWFSDIGQILSLE